MAGTPTKDASSLRTEVSTLRRGYDKAAGRAATLRDALRDARRCLEQRDRQLAVASRAVDRLALDRDRLEGAAAEDKDTIRKLEARLAAAAAPSALRDRCSSQRTELEAQRSELLAAQAKARAAEEVTRKFEREIFMLRAALAVKAEEFTALGGGQRGDPSGPPPVHAHLIMALAHAREEAVGLAAALAEERAAAARDRSDGDRLRAELRGERGKRDAAEAAVLQLQAAVVDATEVAAQLHAEARDHARTAEARHAELQECDDRIGALEQQLASAEGRVVELQAAADTAAESTAVQLASVRAQWEARLSHREGELLMEQQALQKQVARMQEQCREAAGELHATQGALADAQAAIRREREAGEIAVEEERGRARAAMSQVAAADRARLSQDDEISMLHDQVNELTSMNAQLTSDVEDASAAVLALKEARAVVEEKLQRAEAELRHAVAESSNSEGVWRRRCAEQEREGAALKAEVGRLQGALREASGDLAAAQRRRGELESDVAALEQRLEGVAHSKALLQKSMIDQIAVMRNQLGQAQTYNRQLEASISGQLAQQQLLRDSALTRSAVWMPPLPPPSASFPPPPQPPPQPFRLDSAPAADDAATGATSPPHGDVDRPLTRASAADSASAGSRTPPRRAPLLADSPMAPWAAAAAHGAQPPPRRGAAPEPPRSARSSAALPRARSPSGLPSEAHSADSRAHRRSDPHPAAAGSASPERIAGERSSAHARPRSPAVSDATTDDPAPRQRVAVHDHIGRLVGIQTPEVRGGAAADRLVAPFPTPHPARAPVRAPQGAHVGRPRELSSPGSPEDRPSAPSEPPTRRASAQGEPPKSAAAPPRTSHSPEHSSSQRSYAAMHAQQHGPSHRVDAVYTYSDALEAPSTRGQPAAAPRPPPPSSDASNRGRSDSAATQRRDVRAPQDDEDQRPRPSSEDRRPGWPESTRGVDWVYASSGVDMRQHDAGRADEHHRTSRFADDRTLDEGCDDRGGGAIRGGRAPHLPQALRGCVPVVARSYDEGRGPARSSEGAGGGVLIRTSSHLARWERRLQMAEDRLLLMRNELQLRPTRSISPPIYGTRAHAPPPPQQHHTHHPAARSHAPPTDGGDGAATARSRHPLPLHADWREPQDAPGQWQQQHPPPPSAERPAPPDGWTDAPITTHSAPFPAGARSTRSTPAHASASGPPPPRESSDGEPRSAGSAARAEDCRGAEFSSPEPLGGDYDRSGHSQSAGAPSLACWTGGGHHNNTRRRPSRRESPQLRRRAASPPPKAAHVRRDAEQRPRRQPSTPLDVSAAPAHDPSEDGARSASAPTNAVYTPPWADGGGEPYGHRLDSRGSRIDPHSRGDGSNGRDRAAAQLHAHFTEHRERRAPPCQQQRGGRGGDRFDNAAALEKGYRSAEDAAGCDPSPRADTAQSALDARLLGGGYQDGRASVQQPPVWVSGEPTARRGDRQDLQRLSAPQAEAPEQRRHAHGAERDWPEEHDAAARTLGGYAAPGRLAPGEARSTQRWHEQDLDGDGPEAPQDWQPRPPAAVRSTLASATPSVFYEAAAAVAERRQHVSLERAPTAPPPALLGLAPGPDHSAPTVLIRRADTASPPPAARKAAGWDADAGVTRGAPPSVAPAQSSTMRRRSLLESFDDSAVPAPPAAQAAAQSARSPQPTAAAPPPRLDPGIPACPSHADDVGSPRFANDRGRERRSRGRASAPASSASDDRLEYPHLSLSPTASAERSAALRAEPLAADSAPSTLRGSDPRQTAVKGDPSPPPQQQQHPQDHHAAEASIDAARTRPPQQQQHHTLQLCEPALLQAPGAVGALPQASRSASDSSDRGDAPDGGRSLPRASSSMSLPDDVVQAARRRRDPSTADSWPSQRGGASFENPVYSAVTAVPARLSGGSDSSAATPPTPTWDDAAVGAWGASSRRRQHPRATSSRGTALRSHASSGAEDGSDGGGASVQSSGDAAARRRPRDGDSDSSHRGGTARRSGGGSEDVPRASAPAWRVHDNALVAEIAGGAGGGGGGGWLPAAPAVRGHASGASTPRGSSRTPDLTELASMDPGDLESLSDGLDFMT